VQFETSQFHRLEARLNFTPLIDMVFLLNIFFMLTARLTAVGSSVAVELPEASEAQAGRVHPPERLIVNVLADGSLRFGDEPIAMPALRGRLREAGAGAAPVLIRADRNAPLGLVKRVALTCVRAGSVELAFGARPTPAAEGGP
jgi:biopolymer transport protein ExbD